MTSLAESPPTTPAVEPVVEYAVRSTGYRHGQLAVVVDRNPHCPTDRDHAVEATRDTRSWQTDHLIAADAVVVTRTITTSEWTPEGEEPDTVALAAQIAALTKQLATLPIAPADRTVVLSHLGEVMQGAFDTAMAITIAVGCEYNPLIGTTADDLVTVADDAAGHAAGSRDALQEAAQIAGVLDVEKAAADRQALIDAGELPGPDGAYLSTTQRAAIPVLRAHLAKQNGVTQ